MGRVSIDLYANDIGAPFDETTGFASLVGGGPTNISVGTRRLGLNSALLTGVGDDKVGNFARVFAQRGHLYPFYTDQEGAPHRPTLACQADLSPIQ